MVAAAGVTGFTNGNNIGLIVNRGPTNITSTDLSGVTFSVTTSNPSVHVAGGKANTGSPVTPVLPFEAVGTLFPVSPPTSPLLSKVMADETVRNVYPIGLFFLSVDFPVGFVGTVAANVTMNMGGDVARYTILLNIQTDFFNSSFTVVRAGRVSSQPGATATSASSWGAIKKLYR